ncbi:MAG: 50S ribosome-binding GTPase [Gammaproteobacteria bacterium]|jgi:GTP-binding protein EngB required for normal cell division
MTRNLTFRLVLALGVLVALLLLSATLLNLAKVGLTLWEHLEQAAIWIQVLFGMVALLLLGFGLWLTWLILRPARKPAPRPAEPLTEAALLARLDAAAESGVDVATAERELAELGRRRSQETIYLALFGEISSGKSSLINALLPGAEVATDVVGGTTTAIRHYRWQPESGDEVMLVDVPGLNQTGRDSDRQVIDEAHRAHIVIFVCDGDLTRDEHRALQPLLELGKPLIIAFNKLDRYSDADRQLIRERLVRQFRDHRQVVIAGIATCPVQQVVRVGPDGMEQETSRVLPPQIDELKAAVQRVLDGNPELLEHLRDTAVFALTQRKLDQSRAAHRSQEAAGLVKKYTRRAVAGGLAAMGPGTDIIIQGYLGTQMVKSLCALYEAPVSEFDLQKLLSLTQQQARISLPLLLAVIGNAAKAFPGAGTLAGGLLHAIAYGLIFDTLGRAVVQTLETRGELRPAPASLLFRDNLARDLPTRARDLARLALEVREEQPVEEEPAAAKPVDE